MTDYSHVVYALSAFALIKRMNCRVFEGRNCRSEPDCPAQVGRTTLGHLHSGAGEVAGLLYSRIDTCISSEFGRRRETTDVTTDFRKDDGSKGWVDAGNSCKLRIKTGQQAVNFGIENVYGRFQRANLFDFPNWKWVRIFS